MIYINTCNIIHIYKANVYWNFRKGDDESHGYKILIAAYHDCKQLDIIGGVQFLLQYKDVLSERGGCGAITFKECGQFQLYSDQIYSPGEDIFIQCMDFGNCSATEVDKRDIYLKINRNIFDTDNDKFYALK